MKFSRLPPVSRQQLGRSVNYINKGLAALSGPPDRTDVVVSGINDDHIGRLQPETLPISQVANESVETHMQNLRFLQCVKELRGGLRGAGRFFPGCVLAELQAAGEGVQLTHARVAGKAAGFSLLTSVALPCHSRREMGGDRLRRQGDLPKVTRQG